MIELVLCVRTKSFEMTGLSMLHMRSPALEGHSDHETAPHKRKKALIKLLALAHLLTWDASYDSGGDHLT